MRVVIVTAGSRGDVAPYTGLGQRLRGAGCEVSIATHDTLADVVRAAGLEFRWLPGDPRSVIRIRAQPGPEPAKRQAMIDFVVGLGDGIVDAVAAGTDVVLTSFGQAPLSCLVAGAFGLPSMGVYLAPAVPTDEFPLPGDPAPAEGGNRAAGLRKLEQSRALYAGALPGLIRRLGLPPDAGEAVWDTWLGASGWPISHGFSPTVVPRPADWPASVQVAGYWWPASPAGWRPDPELERFLAAGPPPVFIGFGSMGVGLGPLVAGAVREAGVRAVVQAGWADLSVQPEDDRASGDVLAIGDVPHDRLLPLMAAVVHHAGAGTTAAGLRAGLPTVSVPMLADQPFWAARVHGLGAGPAPVPVAELTPERLATAIRAAVERPEYGRRAADVARLLAAEDGAAAVLRRIGRLT